jgi:hypothetical protein
MSHCVALRGTRSGDIENVGEAVGIASISCSKPYSSNHFWFTNCHLGLPLRGVLSTTASVPSLNWPTPKTYKMIPRSRLYHVPLHEIKVMVALPTQWLCTLSIIGRLCYCFAPRYWRVKALRNWPVRDSATVVVSHVIGSLLSNCSNEVINLIGPSDHCSSCHARSLLS